MSTLYPISSAGLAYDHIIGTGGIGSGIFFSLTGNDTLGREESRMATQLPYKDYCKMHIIMHYVAVLLGAKKNDRFQLYPIGKVGNDDTGKTLLNQMNDVGMNTVFVKVSDQSPTLFSVCFQYPDHTGGNITSAQSASNEVSVDDIEHFFEEFKGEDKKEIILAVPEVPVQTRIKLLEKGRLRGSLNVASVLSSETEEFKILNGFNLTDILSVNIDEAEKISGLDEAATIDEKILNCIEKVRLHNHAITILITCGSVGVYCYSGGQKEFFPALKMPVISTAGAGDAFLSGCIAGICCGLPFIKSKNDSCFSATPLSTATELGILLAALSVTSQDTIHAGANTRLIYELIAENKLKIGHAFQQLFSDCHQNNS